ncbi:MAG: RNA polymerase sigma factor [bacterium]|nr:RNA polymerase sigma factor [bacterium]
MENGQSIEWMLRESAAGNDEAFRALFDEVYDDLFRFIRARVSTREDALDTLQEVFVDLWQALRSQSFIYGSELEFRSFLYTIARRKVARLYRFRKPTVSLEDMENLALSEPDSEPGEIAVLMEAVGKLNNEDGEVIRLRYFSGLPFSQIADLLNRGESAIKVRHHRAIEKLKNMLGYESH